MLHNNIILDRHHIYVLYSYLFFLFILRQQYSQRTYPATHVEYCSRISNVLYSYLFFPLYPASTVFPENIPRYSRGILLKKITVIRKSLTLVGFETNMLCCFISVQLKGGRAQQFLLIKYWIHCTIFFITARPRELC